MRVVVCACGRRIEQSGRGRPRTKCETCAPKQKRPNIVTLPIARIVPPPPSSDVPVGSVAATVRAALTDVGKLDTPDGAVAVHLAALLDQGGHTGPSAASLARELRAACTAALAGTEGASDALDELRARRGS